jgi:hypothetical protein
MDTVRVSTGERKDLRYMGDYYESRTANTAEECRQECISDLDCRAWTFRQLPFGSPGTTIYKQTTSQCLLSNILKRDEARVELSPGSISGLVEYQKVPDYGKTLMWMGILAVILFLVWYLLTKWNDSYKNMFMSDGGTSYDVIVEESVIFF